MDELIRIKQESSPIPIPVDKISHKNGTISNYDKNNIIENKIEEEKQNFLIQNEKSEKENVNTNSNNIEKREALETLDTIESKLSPTTKKSDLKNVEENHISYKDENFKLNENNNNSEQINHEKEINISQNNEIKGTSQFSEVSNAFQVSQNLDNLKKISNPSPVSLEEIKNKYDEGIDLTVIQEDEDDKRYSTMKSKNLLRAGTYQSNNSNNNIIEVKSSDSNEIMHDKIFKITDKSTGKVYDLRNQEEMILIQNGVSKLSNLTPLKEAKAWDSWWKKKKISNQHLFSATDKNSISEVRDALNYSKYKELTADVNAKGLDDWTALHIAVNENYDQVLLVLLENGANIEANTSIGRTPLHLAALRGHRKIFEILLSAGAKLNPQDKEGNTPLHFLSENGHADLLKMFLVKSPDVSMKNNMGETALKVAANMEIRNVF